MITNESSLNLQKIISFDLHFSVMSFQLLTCITLEIVMVLFMEGGSMRSFGKWQLGTDFTNVLTNIFSHVVVKKTKFFCKTAGLSVL